MFIFPNMRNALFPKTVLFSCWFKISAKLYINKHIEAELQSLLDPWWSSEKLIAEVESKVTFVIDITILIEEEYLSNWHFISMF